MTTEAARYLNDNFFAKRVIRIIQHGGQADAIKRSVLERILEYLDTIESGKKQMRTGTLVERPVKSILAYHNAIEIVSFLPCDQEITEEHFNEILSQVRNEVNTALDNNYITIDSLKTTYAFFKQARKLAITRLTKESMKRQEHVTWQTPMQF